jgi:hypothetical protein
MPADKGISPAEHRVLQDSWFFVRKLLSWYLHNKTFSVQNISISKYHCQNDIVKKKLQKKCRD